MKVTPSCLLFVALAACSGSGQGGDGPGLAVHVAPLSLPGAADVCYGLYVQNGAGDLVASLPHICSSQYGNGADGDRSYVVPCDADGACERGLQSCTNGTWDATCVGEIGPVAEVPGNLVDDDCDGATDEP